MVDKKIPKENFGPYIRKLRINLNITQRDLAKRAGIAPSYLNDLEKEKRSAPKLAVIKKISNGIFYLCIRIIVTQKIF